MLGAHHVYCRETRHTHPTRPSSSQRVGCLTSKPAASRAVCSRPASATSAWTNTLRQDADFAGTPDRAPDLNASMVPLSTSYTVVSCSHGSRQARRSNPAPSITTCMAGTQCVIRLAGEAKAMCECVTARGSSAQCAARECAQAHVSGTLKCGSRHERAFAWGNVDSASHARKKRACWSDLA
jgi:hypothetical protein